MRRGFFVVVALAATGCPAELTAAGREVRLVEASGVSRCTRVGAVVGRGGNGPSTGDNERVATDQIRNRVAKLGGNAYAVTSREYDALHTVVRADAYRCPQWEPVRGLAPR